MNPYANGTYAAILWAFEDAYANGYGGAAAGNAGVIAFIEASPADPVLTSRQRKFLAEPLNRDQLEEFLSLHAFDVWKHAATAVTAGCRPKYLADASKKLFKPNPASTANGITYTTLIPKQTVPSRILLYSLMSAGEQTNTKNFLDDLAAHSEDEDEVQEAQSAKAALVP